MKEKSKQHKQITIDYDTDGKTIENISFNGNPLDLTAALTFGGQQLRDCAINATLRLYLQQPSREAFLAVFFDTVHTLDKQLFKEIKNETLS